MRPDPSDKGRVKLFKTSGYPDYVQDSILYWVRSNWKYSYEETSDILKTLSILWSARASLAFVLNEEKGADDPLAFLSLEIQADIEASILLAVSGFYRHARTALRGWLSLAFLSVWFSFNRKHFDSWIHRSPEAPFKHGDVMKRRCLKELVSKSSSLSRSEIEFALVENSMKLYEELCDFVHATGKKALDIYQRADSVPHFHPELLKSWFDDFYQVFEILIILSFARYPVFF